MSLALKTRSLPTNMPAKSASAVKSGHFGLVLWLCFPILKVQNIQILDENIQKMIKMFHRM